MVEPSICPICKKDNHCMINSSERRCWCMNTTISKTAIKRIPEEFRGKQCICESCNERAKMNNFP